MVLFGEKLTRIRKGFKLYGAKDIYIRYQFGMMLRL